MTGRFAFFPELVPRSTPKVHSLGRDRLRESLLVHIPQHQHRPIKPILNDDREKPLAVELELICRFLTHRVMPLEEEYRIGQGHHVRANTLSLGKSYRSENEKSKRPRLRLLSLSRNHRIGGRVIRLHPMQSRESTQSLTRQLSDSSHTRSADHPDPYL